MHRILAVSNNGEMLKIEKADAPKGYVWYFMTNDVKQFVKSSDIKTGDEVEYKSEEIKGEDTVTFIKRVGGGTGTQQPQQKTYGKSEEEQNSIKRQAIMHAVSRTMISFQNQDSSVREQEIRKLYSLYRELVG